MTKGKKQTDKKALLLVILLLLFVLAIGGGVLAKYVYSNDGENALVAKEFYFTSDLLTTDGEEYLLNHDTSSVTFSLGNNADKLRFSKDDINYTVQANQGTLSKSEGTFQGDKVSTTEITLSNLKKGETYTVTVTGDTKNSDSDREYGYRKVLKATFKLADDDKYVYKHIETDALKDTYAVLTVWTGNVIGDLKISYKGQDLIPDSTDDVLNEVYNFADGEYGAFEVADEDNFGKPYSSKAYRFFVDKNENPLILGELTEDDFVVTLIDGSNTYLAQNGTL